MVTEDTLFDAFHKFIDESDVITVTGGLVCVGKGDVAVLTTDVSVMLGGITMGVSVFTGLPAGSVMVLVSDAGVRAAVLDAVTGADMEVVDDNGVV